VLATVGTANDEDDFVSDVAGVSVVAGVEDELDDELLLELFDLVPDDELLPLVLPPVAGGVVQLGGVPV
jgi:hypothetical protein